MEPKPTKNISQCQSDLHQFGYCFFKIELLSELKIHIKNENYAEVDKIFKNYTANSGYIMNVLKNFCSVKEIEFIISLRDAQNEWEEDGIWHDDGSRVLAFSLSLTEVKPKGGILEFRKKGTIESRKIITPDYGTMIIFKTGVENFEHKINAVEVGRRLIVAGWCYPTV
jgi:hypothetical protein